jgi:hypothetical protein
MSGTAPTPATIHRAVTARHQRTRTEIEICPHSASYSTASRPVPAGLNNRPASKENRS